MFATPEIGFIQGDPKLLSDGILEQNCFWIKIMNKWIKARFLRKKFLKIQIWSQNLRKSIFERSKIQFLFATIMRLIYQALQDRAKESGNWQHRKIGATAWFRTVNFLCGFPFPPTSVFIWQHSFFVTEKIIKSKIRRKNLKKTKKLKKVQKEKKWNQNTLQIILCFSIQQSKFPINKQEPNSLSILVKISG